MPSIDIDNEITSILSDAKHDIDVEAPRGIELEARFIVTVGGVVSFESIDILEYSIIPVVLDTKNKGTVQFPFASAAHVER